MKKYETTGNRDWWRDKRRKPLCGLAGCVQLCVFEQRIRQIWFFRFPSNYPPDGRMSSANRDGNEKEMKWRRKRTVHQDIKSMRQCFILLCTTLFYFLNIKGVGVINKFSKLSKYSIMLSLERIVKSLLISWGTTWAFIHSRSSFAHSFVQIVMLNKFRPDNLLGNWFRHREEQMQLLKFKCFSSLLSFPPHS